MIKGSQSSITSLGSPMEKNAVEPIKESVTIVVLLDVYSMWPEIYAMTETT